MGTTTISIEEVRAQEGKEEQEESILALLGIIGTFLNLFVIVFVYIYTTLWEEGSTRVKRRGRLGAVFNRDMTEKLTSHREELGRWHWAAQDGGSDASSWPLTPYGYISQWDGHLFNADLWTHGERFLDLYSCRTGSWAKGHWVSPVVGIT